MTDNPDLHCARGWLARASDVLTSAEDYLSAVEYAHAAAVIGNGYVNLAHATRALDAMAESAKVTARQLEAFAAIADAADRTGDPTLEAAAEREERAVAEARPHDNEPPAAEQLPFTSDDVGKRIRFPHTGSVDVIIAVDEAAQTLTFAVPDDHDDNATESFADLVAVDAEVLRG